MDSTTERPGKRQRTVPGQDAAGNAPEAEGAAEPPPAAEQLKHALQKIANHISNSSKFPKASQLLRQVMDAVDKPHRDDFFAAVKAAFAHPEHCTDPLLRKDYVRLIKAVNLRSDVFSRQQRLQLEVYSIWALLQNELFTDDSFVFNKVIGKIKTSISELPDGDAEQEAAWAGLYPEQAAALGLTAAATPTAAGKAQAQPAKQKQQQVGAGALTVADEADPFGLDDFIAKAEAQAAAEAAVAAGPSSSHANADTDGTEGGPGQTEPTQPGATATVDAAAAAAAAGSKSSLTWDPVSCMVMQKQALLDCIVTARTHQHKFAWARTSVEILIEDIAKPSAQGGFADRFVGGQKQQLQELLKFVHSERAARKSGVNRRPGGKGTGDYLTTFEKARAEWSSASWVSARGKVGSQGDAKTQNWLG